MPHGIYPIELAKELKADSGKQWEPSNGTEGCKSKLCRKCGERFESRGCPSCAKARVDRWRKANPGASEEWRQKNIAALKEKKAQWRLKNLARVKENIAHWKAKNPEANRLHGHNRRARMRRVEGALSANLTEKLRKLQRGKCACCGRPLGNKFHLDHIVPLALGGPNIDSNIQLLRAACNQKKYSTDPIEYMQSKGFLL